MLCANVATALFYEENDLPILYRVHEGPTEEKLEGLRGFLGELGLDLRGGSKPTPLHYQELLQAVADRPDAHVIQTMLLRSLSQAVYQPQNEGHFGLHYPAYTHFTSPIRRYPDLLVHRGIRSLIRSKRKVPGVMRVEGAEPIPAQRIFPYDLPAMALHGDHCSMTERRADDATREVEAWLKCEYLQEHVGDEFDGVIAAVTSFGLFVELVDLYIEGLVHVTALPGDYYNFDHSRQRLTGERTGRSFQLGGKVRVQVARVDLDDRKIDLDLVEAALPRKAKGKKGGKGGKGNEAAGSRGEKSGKAGSRKAGSRKTGSRQTGSRKAGSRRRK
jgi:ribonuclease R